MNILEMYNISKHFGNIQSLNDVNFDVGYNEIVGLLGDNGAGKSTLIKIITGYYQPDPGGHIYWNGDRVKLSVSKSRKLGIETVYQERALTEQQPIWRNIFMGRELTRRGFLRIHNMRNETNKLMRDINFTGSSINANKLVSTMSGGERQGIAIARALYFHAKLIILDEPTMGLSLLETKKVLEFIDGIKENGKSCIFIDHNIFHVHSVADRIVILDRGRVAGSLYKDEVSLKELTKLLQHIAK